MSDFNYMFNNSLMKGRTQDVKAKWTLDKLIILGNNTFTSDGKKKLSLKKIILCFR